MVAIINYNVGNLHSIQNMFKKIGVKSIVTNNKTEIEAASHLLLPGVGSFDYCMTEFHNSGLQDIIAEKVHAEKTPILGICVGHQMLFENSEEGNQQGLAWLEGKIVKFKEEQLPAGFKIPNMGWCDMSVKENAKLFAGIDDPRFYMVHSFYASCDDNLVTATANYGHDFVASVEHENIFGTQFHPEKSHKFGMKLLKNFSMI